MMILRGSTGNKTCISHLSLWCRILIISFLASGCANIVSPTGGPRDTSPPGIIEAYPPSGSVNFSGNSFSLKFNEFIQTGNLQQQMLISPPVGTPPKTRLKGKSLIISFVDTLRPNSTYAVYLGNSIQDITERNAMAPYTYFFSTGAEIDNYYLDGRLYNARDQKVPDNVLVMLYEYPMSDSAVMRELPRYVTRPDKSGYFEFRHLSAGSYHLFALQDMNNNMHYDLITETAGFISEPVEPYEKVQPVRDSVSDTVVSGDTAFYQQDKPGVLQQVIRMFVAEDSIQKVLAARSEGRNKAVVALRYPMADPQIKVLDATFDSISLIHINDRKDTVTIWLRKHQGDTLRLYLNDPLKFSDTLSVQLRQPASARSTGREAKPSFSMNVPKGGKLNPLSNPSIKFSLPLLLFEKGNALLLSAEDTVPLELTEADSLIPLKYYVANTLTPGREYSVMIPEGSCTGWDGSINDTLKWTFTSDEPGNYGSITAVIGMDSLINGPVLLMIADERMNIIGSRKLEKGRPENFYSLLPGKYFFQVILDENSNGRWDTGDYWRGIQPEKVSLLKTPVNVRANWEEEVIWEVVF